VPPAKEVTGVATKATAATPNRMDNALFMLLPPCD
jgi:hypothetical protein